MNEQVIHDYFRAKGLNEYGIAGLMGNLFAESGLNPKNLQNSYENALGMNDNAYVAAVDNGTYTNFVQDKAGFGLAQWTYWSRKQALLNFAKASGKSIGDLNMQLDFLWKELSESYPSVLAVLKTALSVFEASNAVLLNYERPANQSVGVQKKRAEYGQRYYDQFAMTIQKGGSAMKYSERNKPLVCMQTHSTCYQGTRKMDVKGVLWHSTGANNPTLRRYVQPGADDPNYANLMALLGKNNNGNDWNHTSVQAGLNCWIGKLADGSVTTVQTMPWNYRPWGCGSGSKGSCNNGWIQFEICEDGLADADYFNKVYKEACEITAYLCKLYNIDPHGTVLVNGVKVPTFCAMLTVAGWSLALTTAMCFTGSRSLGSQWRQRGMMWRHCWVLHRRQSNKCELPGKGYCSRRIELRDNPNGSIIMTYPAGTLLSISQENNGWGFTGTGWVSLDWVEKIKTDNGMEDEDMDMTRFKELFSEMRKDLQDNDSGAYSKEAREWALATGLIAGNGTQINGEPNCMWQDFLTREQLVTVLYVLPR